MCQRTPWGRMWLGSGAVCGTAPKLEEEQEVIHHFLPVHDTTSFPDIIEHYIKYAQQ